jgi:predicted XRE-type DNA-binding protein
MIRTRQVSSLFGRIFDVSQPRVGDLVRGKIALFGLDALVKTATAAGLHIELKVRKAA